MFNWIVEAIEHLVWIVYGIVTLPRTIYRAIFHRPKYQWVSYREPWSLGGWVERHTDALEVIAAAAAVLLFVAVITSAVLGFPFG